MHNLNHWCAARLPQITEPPDLIRCEHAKRKGWPETIRKGATICVRCDRPACEFHPHGSMSYRVATHFQSVVTEPPPSRPIQQGYGVTKPAELTPKIVLRFFPAPDLRSYQTEIITQVANAFSRGKRCDPRCAHQVWRLIRFFETPFIGSAAHT
jgi:hypothetical protein